MTKLAVSVTVLLSTLCVGTSESVSLRETVQSELSSALFSLTTCPRTTDLIDCMGCSTYDRVSTDSLVRYIPTARSDQISACISSTYTSSYSLDMVTNYNCFKTFCKSVTELSIFLAGMVADSISGVNQKDADIIPQVVDQAKDYIASGFPRTRVNECFENLIGALNGFTTGGLTKMKQRLDVLHSIPYLTEKVYTPAGSSCKAYTQKYNLESWVTSEVRKVLTGKATFMIFKSMDLFSASLALGFRRIFPTVSQSHPTCGLTGTSLLDARVNGVWFVSTAIGGFCDTFQFKLGPMIQEYVGYICSLRSTADSTSTSLSSLSDQKAKRWMQSIAEVAKVAACGGDVFTEAKKSALLDDVSKDITARIR